MKLEDNLATGLEIKTSNIKKAGLGVFATAGLPAGIPIAEYKGDLSLINEVRERGVYEIKGEQPKSLMPRYSLWHPAAKVRGEDGRQLDVYIDAHPTLSKSPIGFGGYINDKHNYNNRPSGYWDTEQEGDILEKNRQRMQYLIDNGYNAQYYPVPTQPYFMILSIKDIEAGEEIYVDYGDPYWEKEKADFLQAKKDNKEFLKMSKAIESGKKVLVSPKK